MEVLPVRRLTERIASLGEAAPGTEAEARVARVAREMLERIGLSVQEQSVACSSWYEESLALYIDGRMVEAVAMPPSPSRYVEGELVYAGEGVNISTSGLEGRVALVGMTSEDPDYVAAQYALCAQAGASAVVFYDFVPHVLRRIVVGIFTSYADEPGLPPPVPAVSIRREDAQRLLTGKHYVQLEVKTRYSEDSSSTNLVAFGSGEARVLVTAHVDRWLAGTADDAVGVALVCSLAEELNNLRGVAFALFGAEEYGAPHFNPCYWLWGSRNFVKRLASTGELEELVAIVNLDVVARRPLTISASGLEFREALKSMLGPAVEYELDSPYFDSYSFSSVGVAAMTIHSLWRYVDFYHTDHDSPASIDWGAVAEAKGLAERIVRELLQRGHRLFRYDAWRTELISRLEYASKYASPPKKLLDLVYSFEVDERIARELRRSAIEVVREGEWYEPGLLRSHVFPELLVLEDLELIEKLESEGLDHALLKRLKHKWSIGVVRKLPSIPLYYVAQQLNGERLSEYLAHMKPTARAWVEESYRMLTERLEKMLSGPR